MNWPSASAFFDMGGYGLYVWGSYAVTALLMGAEPWLVSRRQRAALARAASDALDTELQP
jgi:heme exporter protein D